MATHHAKLGNKHDSATNYVDAANCYKKSDPKFGTVLKKSHFIKSFLEENYVRQVRYWFDDVCTETSNENYDKKRIDFKDIFLYNENTNLEKIWHFTKTSNDNIGFQLMFLNIVISSDLKKTADLMDQTNGKCEERVLELQKRWKDYKKSFENQNKNHYKTWFQHIQFPQLYENFRINKTASISDCNYHLKNDPGRYVVSQKDFDDIQSWKVNVFVYDNICKALKNGKPYWSFCMKNMVYKN